ncbi:MAG TPA: pyridoxamine 5'-phosphate oxidase family protein [Chloroflexaceae bacterium]|nr:pyridoxamine 5'-phosphate oxidase family protein [Chloroflexaceae bacterium]
MNEQMMREQSIERVRELIKGIKIAMLTTVEDDGTLRSRPMDTQEIEFDGDLWFLTEADAPKVDDVQHERQVNVTYANPDKMRYVSVSGTAQIVHDVQKKRELWKPDHKIWFPNGPDDPNVALLKVHVEKGEYWDSGSNAVGRLFDFAKAMITGDHEQLGDNQKLDLGR